MIVHLLPSHRERGQCLSVLHGYPNLRFRLPRIGIRQRLQTVNGVFRAIVRYLVPVPVVEDIPDALRQLTAQPIHELQETIQTGLKSLPDDYRVVLVLRELHQLSYQEISDALDVDIGTVKSRINRGRKRLCEFLVKSGNFSFAAPSKKTEKEGQ